MILKFTKLVDSSWYLKINLKEIDKTKLLNLKKYIEPMV